MSEATISMFKLSGVIMAIVVVVFGSLLLILDKSARDAIVRWLADDEEWEVDAEASMKRIPARLEIKRRE